MDCAEDLALVGRLEEDDEAGDDGDVGELAAGVFASGDGGGRGVGGEGGEEGGLRGMAPATRPLMRPLACSKSVIVREI